MPVLNLYQKIVEVRKVADGFKKDSKSYDYEYVSGNQILSKIKDKMNELHLLLIPSTRVGEHCTFDYTTAKGKEKTDFVVKGEMIYTWINGENPEERLDVTWAYYGQQDDISKAYGSALTYSERYFLLKCLGLPTDEDDPDMNSQPKAPPSNIATEAQIKKVHVMLKKAGGSEEKAKEHYKVKSLTELTKKQASELIEKLQAKIDEKESA